MENQVTIDVRVEEQGAIARGRQSLDRTVWYNGWLMTFLATGEETQGKFALIEAVARKGSVPPRISITGKKNPSMFWKAR